MDLSNYLLANKNRLIETWKNVVTDRLQIRLESSQLVDHLPEYIDESIAKLQSPNEPWPVFDAAIAHGRHRMQTGLDIGALNEEMMIVLEAIYMMAEKDNRILSPQEQRLLIKIISRGASASINSYAISRDEEIQNQTIKHYSFIAHELRTPLQSARMALQLLEENPERNSGKFFHILKSSLNKVSELVDLSLVKAQLSGKPKMKIKNLHVEKLIETSLEEIKSHAEIKNIQIELKLEDYEIYADSQLMVSAITNLLKNAVKHTKEKGRIVIRAVTKESKSIIEVMDECGGMPKELPGKLFQPFIQGDPKKDGFGLGLMIVKQAVDAHEGAVRVLNNPGKGCCFVLETPLRMKG